MGGNGSRPDPGFFCSRGAKAEKRKRIKKKIGWGKGREKQDKGGRLRRLAQLQVVPPLFNVQCFCLANNLEIASRVSLVLGSRVIMTTRGRRVVIGFPSSPSRSLAPSSFSPAVFFF